MTILEAIQARHSIRSYRDEKIAPSVLTELKAEIDACNKESGLHIQLICDDPGAMSGFLARYGKFSGVNNYIAMVGRKSPDFEERVGYYGERIVLKAQQLGLGTCWIGGTYNRGKSKEKCTVAKGEKLSCILSVGYGAVTGIPHKSKPLDALCKVPGEMPEWFKNGMNAVLLAPTAINQQKFLFSLRSDGLVKAESTGGFFSQVDLGIVKYHFETGAGKDNFQWAPK